MAQVFCGAEGVFYEGLAVTHEVVENQPAYFHILRNGQPAYPQRYKMAEYFQNGLAWAQKHDGTWIRIDKMGREVPMKDTNTPLKI